MPARILVVDDNPWSAELQIAILKDEDYVFSTAADGFEALAQIEAEKPDLILLDVIMPRMDGFETCRRIRADPATAHIPVIMVTALSDASSRAASFEAGADDFLTKPFAFTVLLTQVRSLLRQKGCYERIPEPEGAIPPTQDDLKDNYEVLERARVLQREGRPDIVQQLINLFFKDAAGLLKDLEEGAANRDAVTLHHASHALKSLSASVGAVILSSRCKELEAMAQSGVVADAVPMVGAILEDYRAVEILLSARYPKGA